MNKPARLNGAKKATNISLPGALVDEAKRLGINMSQACEGGLSDRVKKARELKWLDENKGTLLAWNQWVEENGMLYDEYRQA
jgi:antitoxin CcdA